MLSQSQTIDKRQMTLFHHGRFLLLVLVVMMSSSDGNVFVSASDKNTRNLLRRRQLDATSTHSRNTAIYVNPDYTGNSGDGGDGNGDLSYCGSGRVRTLGVFVNPDYDSSSEEEDWLYVKLQIPAAIKHYGEYTLREIDDDDDDDSSGTVYLHFDPKERIACTSDDNEPREESVCIPRDRCYRFTIDFHLMDILRDNDDDSSSLATLYVDVGDGLNEELEVIEGERSGETKLGCGCNSGGTDGCP